MHNSCAIVAPPRANAATSRTIDHELCMNRSIVERGCLWCEVLPAAGPKIAADGVVTRIVKTRSSRDGTLTTLLTRTARVEPRKPFSTCSGAEREDRRPHWSPDLHFCAGSPRACRSRFCYGRKCVPQRLATRITISGSRSRTAAGMSSPAPSIDHFGEHVQGDRCAPPEFRRLTLIVGRSWPNFG